MFTVATLPRTVSHMVAVLGQLLGKSHLHWVSQAVLVVKKPPANAGDIRDMDSIPV